MVPSRYIVIGFIAFIFLTALLIAWFNQYRQRKEEKSQLRHFNDFVIDNNLTIDHCQRFNRNIIGIDRLHFAVVFWNDAVRRFSLVRLEELHSCRLVQERDRASGHINRIYL